MSREETIVMVFPDRGTVSGRLDSRVFQLAKTMPGHKRWVKGELWFDPSDENLDVVRKYLEGATWYVNGMQVEEGDYSQDIVVKKFELESNISEHEFIRPPIGGQLAAFNKAVNQDVFALFMWMGTGKTFVALNLAARWFRMGLINAVLVAAPKGVDKQWLNKQLPLHMPTWCPWHGFLHRAGKKVRWDEGEGLRWLCMNIEGWSSKSGQDVAWSFAKMHRCLIIIDESTRIKTPGASRSKFAVKIGALAKKRMILSGLPVTRGLEDLFMQFKFLDWNIIGSKSFYGFRARYCVMGGWQNKAIVSYKDIPDLLKKIEPYCFIAPRLPGTPTTYSQREHELTAEQKRMYREIKYDLLTYLKDKQGVAGQDKLIVVAHAGASLIKLQQIVNGYIEEPDTGELRILSTERFETCADWLEEAGEQRCLIFCRFHHDLTLLGQELTKRGRKWGEYSGRNTSTRDEELAKLKRGEIQDLVMTAASGGIGLDIPEASVAIYFSNSFNFEHREQSLFRMDRIGQTRDLTIGDIIGGPIDNLMLKNYDTKRSLGDVVMSLTEDDL